MKRNNMKPTTKESMLFPLEEIRADKNKHSFPYRGYHPKKECSPNKRLWMELYPNPKRQTEPQPPEAQETLWHDGEIF